MPFVASIDSLFEGDFPPILLMFGEERYLLDEGYEKLMSALIPDEQAKFDFESFDANDADYNVIVDSCLSFPFVSKKRVVLVNNFEAYIGRANKKEQIHGGFDKYLDNPQLSTTLILKGDIKLLNGLSDDLKNSKKRVKAEKAIKSFKFPLGKIVQSYPVLEFPKMREYDYPKWVFSQFKQAGRDVEPGAVELLLAQTNKDLREINQEIQKVLLFAKGRNIISADDIASSLGTSRIYNVFELQKAVGSRNLSKSIEIMQKMLENERQEVLIVTILSRYFIALWKLDEVIKKNNNQFVIASTVGINPYFVNEYSDSLRKYSNKEVENAIKLLTAIDEKLKSSQTSAKYLLEDFFVQMMQ